MSITTGVVRASYLYVFQPQQSEEDKAAKYKVTLLIPKSDVQTINAVTTEIEKTKQASIQQLGGNIAGLKLPMYDGDGAMPNGGAWGEECRGHMVIRATSKDQPAIVDQNMQQILNPSELYSGCYIRASINFFAYNQSMNKGIGCGFGAIQKISDGEPLISRVSPEEAFGGANAYGGAPAQFQPSPYQAPAQPTYQTQAQPAQPMYQAPQQVYPQHMYQTPPAQAQPVYPPQSVAPQVDPITGQPMTVGGVMGI